MDPAEQFVIDVHAEMTAMNVGVLHKFGSVKRNEPGKDPLVTWWLGPITFAPAQEVGGAETNSILTEVQELRLRIWHSSRENVRSTLRNVLIAARNVGFAPNLRPGQFDWDDQEVVAHMKRGRGLTGAIGLMLPIKGEPSELVTIESTTHNAYENDVDTGDLHTTDNEPGDP